MFDFGRRNGTLSKSHWSSLPSTKHTIRETHFSACVKNRDDFKQTQFVKKMEHLNWIIRSTTRAFHFDDETIKLYYYRKLQNTKKNMNNNNNTSPADEAMMMTEHRTQRVQSANSNNPTSKHTHTYIYIYTHSFKYFHICEAHTDKIGIRTQNAISKQEDMYFSLCLRLASRSLK